MINCPRGTKDILPDTSPYWQYAEQMVREICDLYAYQEIRTPIFEHTELFLRGIGETTDIVEKEMYTFSDKSNRSLTLRPENTASVVRAFLENKLYAEPQLVKVYYVGPMFRYDKPQAGRYRQFHQFGIEAIGAQDALIDAEVIMLAVQFLRNLGLNELGLFINSVGCPACHPIYRDRLQRFLSEKREGLCVDCKSRYYRNPMRILDCKNENCNKLTTGAPQLSECLCEECAQHFSQLQQYLTAAEVKYTINTRLVRGLDYYTKTAFEIQYAPLGAQSAVCGGGRYDGLVAEIGGQASPGIGFAIGMERILLALEKQELLPLVSKEIDLFVAPIGSEAMPYAFKLATRMRAAGLTCDMDFLNRSIKSQMKHANNYPARFVAIIGENEVDQNKVMLKNMRTGVQELVDFTDVEMKVADMEA